MSIHKTVKCPKCKKLTVYSDENPYRPFCSERCQLIDLGDWADGMYGFTCEDSLDENAKKNS